MQRSPSSIMSCIHVRAVVYKEFNDFLIITINRVMQGSPSPGSLHIHTRTGSQLLFDCFNIPFCNGITQRTVCLRVCRINDLRCRFGFGNGFSRFCLGWWLHSRFSNGFSELYFFFVGRVVLGLHISISLVMVTVAVIVRVLVFGLSATRQKQGRNGRGQKWFHNGAKVIALW